MAGDEENNDEEFDAALEDGFKTEIPSAAPTLKKVEEKKVEAPPPEIKPKVEAKEPKEAKLVSNGQDKSHDKLAGFSDEEIENIKALAAKVPEQEKKLSKAFGTIGELQQQLKTLRKDGDARLRGEAPIPESFDNIDLKNSEIIKVIRSQAIEDLDDIHPDWREVVGASDKPDPENPFRKWLSSKEESYQKKVNNSNSATVISRAIDLFKAETVTAAPKPAETNRPKANGASPPNAAQQPNKAKVAENAKAIAARRDRIATAVPPKTTGAIPVRTKTGDDEFEEGFASG